MVMIENGDRTMSTQDESDTPRLRSHVTVAQTEGAALSHVIAVGREAGRWIRYATRPEPPKGRNIDALDGLRGCAVLLVVLLHVLQYDSRTLSILRESVGGWSVLGTGVELFFVLSGFLLFLPYARSAFLDRDLPSSKRFFQRRALRILPAYWASLTIFVLAISLFGSTSIGANDIGLHVLLAHNLLKSTYMSINPVYWTMAVEVQFYLVLPIIAILVVDTIRRGRYWNTVAVFGGIGVVSIIAYAASIEFHRVGGNIAQLVDLPSMFQYLPVFGVGMLASLGFVAATEGPWADRNLRNTGMIVGAAGLVLIGLLVVLNQMTLNHWRYGYVAVNQLSGLAYGAILIGVVLGWRSWQRGLTREWIRFFGMISYIWNFVVLQYFVLPRVGHYVHGSIAFVLVGLVVGLAVLVPVALASYLAVERPFMGARRSLREAQPGGASEIR
jgi:peptidoglycan/LPS O-acetylase OafA/YrhL